MISVQVLDVAFNDSESVGRVLNPLTVCLCREGGEDGDSQGDGSSQPDTISIASRTSQNTVDSDKVGRIECGVDGLNLKAAHGGCDELTTRSCLGATGSPMQLQWTAAGAVSMCTGSQALLGPVSWSDMFLLLRAGKHG